MNRKAFFDILSSLNQGENPELRINSGVKEYCRRFIPGDRLILLGGGHVSLDVYRFAIMLDFRVTVIDDRPSFANNQRFPKADVICGDFSESILRLEITEKDYVCVLTRGHKWDQVCLETILNGTIPYYLGLISSSRRAEGIKALMSEKGFDKAAIDSIHAPIGIMIGAETTAEIALSVCAELIAEKRKLSSMPKDNVLTQTNVNFDLLRFLADRKEPSAVMIVLSSTGSTPVKSGSMMAVNSSGEIRGTIGGGCGEAAALIQARRLIGTGRNMIVSFDLSDDVLSDSDMVCGGEMTVYIEDVS